MVLVVKNPPANVRYIRDVGSIPGLRGSPGGGNGNPFSIPPGQRNLAGHSSQGHNELHMTEATWHKGSRPPGEQLFGQEKAEIDV